MLNKGNFTRIAKIAMGKFLQISVKVLTLTALITLTFNCIPASAKFEPAAPAEALAPRKVFLPIVNKQFGSIYYVSPSGKDTNPGTIDRPFKTIQTGVDRLTAGDTLYVRGGTYSELIGITASGSALADIVISSYPGENVIINSSGIDPQLSQYALVTIMGSHTTFENIELTNPNGRGVLVKNTNNILRKLNIHHLLWQAVMVWGDNTLVEQNKIWQAGKANDCYTGDSTVNHSCMAGGWPGTLEIGTSSSSNLGFNSIIRNNEVYQNYGEGILCEYAENTLIEGNRVWDNWAAQIYADQCSHTTIKDNIIYYTNNMEFWRYPKYPGDGILLSNEGISANQPIGHDRSIFNNIIINASKGIDFWTGFASSSALINDTIANNTIVSNSVYSKGIAIGLPKGVTHQNTVITNNLVLINNGTPGYSENNTGLTFSKNLWSKNPDPSVAGAGDIVGDPLLSNPLLALDNQNAAISTDWYMPSPASPAINKAGVIACVTTDLLGTARGNNPDIGALQHK
jgi:hypothetical protein